MKFSVYIRRLLLLTVFIATGVTAFADDGDDVFAEAKRAADSLKNELRNPSLDERSRMNLYTHITGKYAGFALDSTIVYGEKAIALAEKLGDWTTAHECYCHVGVAYGLLNNYDTAIVLLEKARQCAVAMNSSLAEEGAYWLTAYIYANHGKYVTAIDMYLQLLPRYERRNERQIHIAALCNIAELNRKLGNIGVALKYLDAAAEQCAKLTVDNGHYVWRTSHVYNEYTMLYLLKNDIAAALKYATKADSVNSGGFVINKCATKVLLAKIYLRLADFERAIQYADEAMTTANILKNENMYIDVWKVRSDIYLAQRRYPEAEAEALKAWNADSTNINESRAVAANLTLANIYMNNMSKAAHFFARYSELNRIYSEKSFHAAVSDLSVKYEAAKQKMQLLSMSWQRLLRISFSVAGAILATIVVLIFRMKARKERTEKQLIAVRAILEGEKKERKRIARDLHDGLGGMISSVKMELTAIDDTQNLRNKLDKCIEEIHWIVAGMMPSSLTRFGMKAAIEDYCRRFPIVHFHFFGVEKRIDENTEITIYCCAYELVNNAVNHSGAKTVNVQFVQENDRVSLMVQDNGCGFDTKKIATKGIGMKNINNRVIAFNGVINISSSPDNGTEVNIEFRVKS
jgi:signal transduction histidine kinase